MRQVVVDFAGNELEGLEVDALVPHIYVLIFPLHHLLYGLAQLLGEDGEGGVVEAGALAFQQVIVGEAGGYAAGDFHFGLHYASPREVYLAVGEHDAFLAMVIAEYLRPGLAVYVIVQAVLGRVIAIGQPMRVARLAIPITIGCGQSAHKVVAQVLRRHPPRLDDAPCSVVAYCAACVFAFWHEDVKQRTDYAVWLAVGIAALGALCRAR